MKVPPVTLHLFCFAVLVGMTLIFYKSSLTVQGVCKRVPDCSAFLNRDRCIKILKGFPHSRP